MWSPTKRTIRLGVVPSWLAGSVLFVGRTRTPDIAGTTLGNGPKNLARRNLLELISIGSRSDVQWVSRCW